MIRVNAGQPSASAAGAGRGRRWTDRAAERRAGEGAAFTLPPAVPVAVERRAREEVQRRPRPAAAFVAQILGARLAQPVVDDALEAGFAEARYHAASPEARPIRQGSLVRRDI